MLEKDMEELIARFPSEFIEDGLKLIGRQGNLGGIRYDLLFEDGNKGKLLIEIQRGTLTRDKIAQILEYYIQLKKKEEQPVDLMVVANNIPHHKRDMLESQGIEHREISELKFRKVAEKNNYTLSTNHVTNEGKIKLGIKEEELGIHQIDQLPVDMDTKNLREQLNSLYSEDNSIVLNARRLLHGILIQKFKQYSKLHKNVAHFGKVELWAHHNGKWAFGAYWKKYKDSNPIVYLRLPKLLTSEPATSIHFECACFQGKSKYAKLLWEKALPGINKLSSFYPNIKISDKGESKKSAMIAYESYNTSNITIEDLDNLIKTLANFFDTIDPYLSN